MLVVRVVKESAPSGDGSRASSGSDLTNVRVSAAPSLFEIPSGFRKAG